MNTLSTSENTNGEVPYYKKTGVCVCLCESADCELEKEHWWWIYEDFFCLLQTIVFVFFRLQGGSLCSSLEREEYLKTEVTQAWCRCTD